MRGTHLICKVSFAVFFSSCNLRLQLTLKVSWKNETLCQKSLALSLALREGNRLRRKHGPQRAEGSMHPKTPSKINILYS